MFPLQLTILFMLRIEIHSNIWVFCLNCQVFWVKFGICMYDACLLQDILHNNSLFELRAMLEYPTGTIICFNRFQPELIMDCAPIPTDDFNRHLTVTLITLLDISNMSIAEFERAVLGTLAFNQSLLWGCNYDLFFFLFLSWSIWWVFSS